MSTKNNSNGQENRHKTIAVEIDPDLYAIPDAQVLSTSYDAEAIGQWVIDQLQNKSVVTPNLADLNWNSEQVRLTLDFVVASVPTDIVGYRVGDDKLVFADSVSAFADYLDIDEETVEQKVVQREEARRRLTGENKSHRFKELSDEQYELIESLVNRAARSEEEYVAAIEDTGDSATVEELVEVCVLAQLVLKDLTGKSTYAGVFADKVAVLTTDISVASRELGVSEYELEKDLCSVEELEKEFDEYFNEGGL